MLALLFAADTLLPAPLPSKLVESHSVRPPIRIASELKRPEAVVIDASQTGFLPILPDRETAATSLLSSDAADAIRQPPASISEQADASDGIPAIPLQVRETLAQLAATGARADVTPTSLDATNRSVAAQGDADEAVIRRLLEQFRTIKIPLRQAVAIAEHLHDGSKTADVSFEIYRPPRFPCWWMRFGIAGDEETAIALHFVWRRHLGNLGYEVIMLIG